MKRPRLPLLILMAMLLPAAAQDMGQQMFALCAACHAPDGKGLPDPTPGSTKKLAPPLSGSKLATGKPSVFALIILKGIKKESDDYVQTMAPLPLPAPQLTAVMNHVRTNFGNSADKVTEEQVKSYIEEWKDTPGPVTRELLEKLEVETGQAS